MAPRRPAAVAARSTLAGTELRVEKLIAEGNALGHLADGRVVILQGVVPGDRVILEQVSEHKGLVRVQAYRLIERSALRIEPHCPVFGACGGCDWMMLSPEQQRAHKLSVLREVLQRTAKLDLSARAIPLTAGPSSQGYRRRVRLQVVDGRIGFYERASHALVEPERCAVCSPALNSALTELRQLTRSQPRTLAGARSIELREACGGTLSLFVEPEPGARAPALGALRGRFSTALGLTEAADPALWQRFELTEQTYLLAPPGCFTQVNWEVNRELIARVLAGARARAVSSFLDAHAGAGNFALPLLAQGLSGVAVEYNAQAVSAAREAARLQQLPCEGFRVGDCARVALELAREGRRFDLVLLDPPRAGVKEGLRDLAALCSGWLAICSCNPVTLARDLRTLIDLGFELTELQAFDMFPETHHLECLAWLRAPSS
ncbi:MAG TPA: RsmD family RNA methyltransferase [Polyangiaceae bacterium]|nr:RsmD family RNA methyltransferase [Polyangiaceae bacterium]